MAWSEKAIEAAIAAFKDRCPFMTRLDRNDAIRAALDAAAAVDGDAQWNEAIGAAAQIIDAQVRWHEKAVELAEKIINAVEARVHRECANWLRLKADAIRSLRKPEANTMTTYPVPTKPGYYWAKIMGGRMWQIVQLFRSIKGVSAVVIGESRHYDAAIFTFGPEVTKPDGLE